MKKNTKIIIGIAVAIVVILIIIGCVYLFIYNNQGEKQSKVSKLYENLVNTDKYSFLMTIDDNNKMTYSKEGEQAYINTVYKGETSKFIVKDGNTYLIQDKNKAYYTYKNNETDLDKIELNIGYYTKIEYSTGREKVNNKNYYYEEYQGAEFYMKSIPDNVSNLKTRFYFEGDNLVYIKTIVNEDEEIAKVEINYEVEDGLFQIPSDYEER